MVINNKNYGNFLRVSKLDCFKSNIVFFVTNGHKPKKKPPKGEKIFWFGVSGTKQVGVALRKKKWTSKRWK